MMDGMYGEHDATDFMRDEFGSDFGMFGHYVMNNTSIGLRMAGAGLLVSVLAWRQALARAAAVGLADGTTDPSA